MDGGKTISSEKLRVEGAVQLLNCNRCDATYAHFTFVGDTDALTLGLQSPSCAGRQEVVLVEADPGEWDDPALLERRMATQLRRSDLRVLRILRVENGATAPSGTTFAEFRKSYRRLTVVYSCASCRDGECRAAEKLSVEDFQSAGGHISLLGRLTF